MPVQYLAMPISIFVAVPGRCGQFADSSRDLGSLACCNLFENAVHVILDRACGYI
jgi:hypothetical protein